MADTFETGGGLRRWSVLLLALIGMVSVGAYGNGADIEQMNQQVAPIAKGLARGDQSYATLDEWRSTLARLKPPVNACISDTEEQKIDLREQIDSLGEALAGEPADVRKKRRQLKSAIAGLDKDLANCRLLDLRIKELAQRVNDNRQDLLARELLAKGPDLWELVLLNLKQPGAWRAAGAVFIGDQSGLRILTRWQWLTLLAFAGLTFVIAKATRDRLRRWAAEREWFDDYSSRFVQALTITSAHHAPRIMTALAVSIYLYLATLDHVATPFINLLSYGVSGCFLTIAGIRLLLYPPAPAKAMVTMSAGVARGLSRRLTVLALLGLVGYLLFFTLLAASLPDPVLLLARSVFAFFCVLNLVWALGSLVRGQRFSDYRWLFLLMMLTLVASLGTEWLGHRNLSLAIWRVLFGTGLALGAAVLLTQLLRGLFDCIDEGRYEWNRQLKTFLNVPADNPVPGVVWLRLIATVLIWLGFASAEMRVWNISETVSADLRAYLLHGFDIGTLHLVPSQMLWAVIIMALLIAAGGWLRSQLDRHWLQHTRIERGTREALVTMTGYLITLVAVLIGLGIVGLDFSNLAIVAGALSVGIGFGLQNIVNNFVSGLILLFERPVKTGDWIVVGATEGYIKSIRIRSTRIQTFDRADVIVPNSELIASQVTNKMLDDTRGRISIPVGVAYGSDTRKVKEILERVANEHPGAVTSGFTPEPHVLFRAFGDSALEFELRVFIHNIDQHLHIVSDINFAIDAAFREAHIEIPFPQRDVHIRDWPDRPADNKT